MSNKNNVIPFPSKTDASLVEYRNTVSKLIILEAQLHMMLEDIDVLENQIQTSTSFAVKSVSAAVVEA